MRANLLAEVVEEFGIGSRKNPCGTIAGVDLVSGGVQVEQQGCAGGRLNVVGDRRSGLRGTFNSEAESQGKSDSHEYKFGMNGAQNEKQQQVVAPASSL
jgi:hypothetical protein